MKTKLLTLTAVFCAALTSCQKETITPKDGGVIISRSEQPPSAKYEFIVLEAVPCNTTIATGQYRLFYSSCNNSPFDNSITDVKVWFREYKWTTCVAGVPQSPGIGWVLVQNACGTINRSKWVKQPLVTPPTVDLWRSICLSGSPLNPNNDPNYTGTPSSNWELIASNCGTYGGVFWKYQ